MLRKFASVSTRISLSLQDQVNVLEERLNKLDWEYSRTDAEDVNMVLFVTMTRNV